VNGPRASVDHSSGGHGPARLSIVGAAALFSTAGVFIKAVSLDGWEVSAVRAAWAAATVWLLVPAARRGMSWRAALVAVAYAASVILFAQANKRTTAANTIFLQSTSPAYIALLAHWLLGERVRARDLGALAAMALGMACVLAGLPPPAVTAPDPRLGNALALASGVTCAFMMVGLRALGRAGGPEGGAPAAVVLGNLLAFAVALPFAWPIAAGRPADWLMVSFLGVFQIGVAYALLLRGLRHVSVLEASLLLFVEPVLNPVWAWLVHGEQPGPWALAGGAIILVAALAPTVWDARRGAVDPPAGGAAA
jgi:drug/metabolite transporter (DMT)-like permease